jgi:hypothetical protein
MGEVTPKGFSEPVAVFDVVAVREQPADLLATTGTAPGR